MNGETYIAIEEVLAAAVDSYGGRLEVNMESLEKSYAGKVIAVDYDMQTNRAVITLVDRDELDFGDE